MNLFELIILLFNDSSNELKEAISYYKETFEMLDDCDFVKIIESLPEGYTAKELDELFVKESFTKEEEERTYEYLKLLRNMIHSFVEEKIELLKKILER